MPRAYAFTTSLAQIFCTVANAVSGLRDTPTPYLLPVASLKIFPQLIAAEFNMPAIITIRGYCYRSCFNEVCVWS